VALRHRLIRRRSGRPAAGPAPVQDAPGAAAPSRASADGEWRSVPPLRRAITDRVLVADPLGFRDGLPTHRAPTFRTELGHLVDPLAPSGLVHAVARRTTGGAVQRTVDTALTHRRRGAAPEAEAAAEVEAEAAGPDPVPVAEAVA